jgi:peptidoglycan-N-acetylglucosamine deacetylase
MSLPRVTATAVLMLLAVAGCARSPQSPPAAGPSAAPMSSATTTPTTTPASPGPWPATSTAPPAVPPAVPTTDPTPGLPTSLLGRDVERVPTSDRVVALTFDAGANADGVSSILATLEQYDVRATFFLTGDFVSSFPDPARRIAAAGHRLGNHSVDHPSFTQLTDEQIRSQLRTAADAISTTTGSPPGPFFRFPYGDRDARTIAVVNAAGYLAVRWTIDSLGWQGTMGGTRDPGFVVQRVLAAGSPGEIVLMHVGSNPDDHSTLDAAALPTIIASLRANGYTFVTLDALVA